MCLRNFDNIEIDLTNEVKKGRFYISIFHQSYNYSLLGTKSVSGPIKYTNKVNTAKVGINSNGETVVYRIMCNDARKLRTSLDFLIQPLVVFVNTNGEWELLEG